MIVLLLSLLLAAAALAVCRWLAVAGPREGDEPTARAAGLTAVQVETLARRGMPESLSPREQCAWRFTHTRTGGNLLNRHAERRGAAPPISHSRRTRT